MIRKGLTYLMLATFAAFTLVPLLWMVLVSLRPAGSELPTFPALVEGVRSGAFYWENYAYVLGFRELPVARFAWNSVVVTCGVVGFQLVLCSTAAYAFARIPFPGRGPLFAVFLLTMMIPSQAMIVPLFLVVKELGWLNTYAGLIIPYPYLSTAFGTFLLRQFFAAVPKALDDAARIDGCGHFGVFRHVILPSSKPALATIAAFAFIWTWTDFYWPLLSTSSVRMRTLEVGLSVFKHAYGMTNWPLQMTAAVIVTTPVLVMFLLLQRFFVRGVVMSGIKG
ncbi:MAG: sugar ABC transporter permease [Planctomycetota bacterium]|nr:MAG: sugar ABC transporter permease [Planctomycetota bacterium]